jgi:hypothetical protein
MTERSTSRKTTAARDADTAARDAAGTGPRSRSGGGGVVYHAYLSEKNAEDIALMRDVEAYINRTGIALSQYLKRLLRADLDKINRKDSTETKALDERIATAVAAALAAERARKGGGK